MKNNKKSNKFSINVKNIFYVGLVFVPQIVLTWLNKPWQTSLIFLACSVLILIIMNPKPFKEFTIQKDGVSVKLQEVINDAYATIDLMKDTMDPIIRLQADILKTSGTFNSMTVREYLRVKDEMIKIADKLCLEDTKKYFEEETKNRISGAATSEILILFFDKNHINGEEKFGALSMKLRKLFYEDFNEYLVLTKELADKLSREDDKVEAQYLIDIIRNYHTV